MKKWLMKLLLVTGFVGVFMQGGWIALVHAACIGMAACWLAMDWCEQQVRRLVRTENEKLAEHIARFE